MKRIVLVLMVVTLCIGCASLKYTAEGYKLKYEIKKSGNTQTIIITGYSGRSKTVEIPESIDGIPVTEIGPEAFYKKRLESVTIPASVRVIGYKAFDENKLTSVDIPFGVREIQFNAFSYNKLTSVTIPASVTTIGNRAFCYNNLTSITIPASVTAIGTDAFDLNDLNPNNVVIPARFASRSEAIFGKTFYNALIAVENEKKINEANEMYALANRRRDEGNISAAIYYYRGVVAMLPTHTDARNNLKELWDKRIAESQSLYPAPFAGEWKYVIRRAGLYPEQVRDTFAEARIGGVQYKTEYRNMPEQNIVVTFNGRNYTMRSTNGSSFSGTFYYHNRSIDMGNNIFFNVKNGETYIELEGGGFMSFDGTKVYLGNQVYERVR